MCRLASRFGDYRPNDPSSFALNENMSYYPQFMFNLRRSQFVQASSNPNEMCPGSQACFHRAVAANASMRYSRQRHQQGLTGVE